MPVQRRPYRYNVPNLKSKRQQLRNNATLTEKILWEKLKKSQIGYKFRRQFSVCGYILDFYCPSKRLAIELDGGSHRLKTRYDEYRDQYLQSMRIKTLRFTNDEIISDLLKVIKIINSNLTPPV